MFKELTYIQNREGTLFFIDILNNKIIMIIDNINTFDVVPVILDNSETIDRMLIDLGFDGIEEIKEMEQIETQGNISAFFAQT